MDSSLTSPSPHAPLSPNDDDRIAKLEVEIEEAYNLGQRSCLDTVALWNDLGNMCRDGNQLEQAHVFYHRALELSRYNPDEDDCTFYSSSSSSSSSANSSFSSISEESVASSTVDSQVTLEDSLQRQSHPTTPRHISKNKLRQLNIARTWNNLGTLYSKQGNYEIARKYFDQALDKYYNVLAKQRNRSTIRHSIPDSLKKSPDVAVCFHNLGTLYMDVGQSSEAAVHLETALEIHPSSSSRDRTATLEALGELCVELGRYAKAIEYYQQVLDWTQASLKQKQKQDHALLEDVERTAGILGVLCFELGRLQDARSHFQTALDLHSETSEDRAGTLDYLGQIERQLGHNKLAQSYQEQALQLLQ